MIYGYIRVSTDKQTVENQRYEIVQYARNNKLRISHWIEETISGTKAIHKRQLGRLVKKIKKGDIIIASELSRFGRNSMQVMSFLETCMAIGCQVWTLKEQYKLGVDIQSQVLAFAFSISATIERELISQRTRETFKRMRAEGRELGRPKGLHNKIVKLKGCEPEIKNLLMRRVPKVHIARQFGVSPQTLYRFIKNNLRSHVYINSITRPKNHFF